MKKIILILAMSCAVSSCAVNGSRFQNLSRDYKGIVAQNSPNYYSYNNGEIGAISGRLNNRANDTISICGYRFATDLATNKKACFYATKMSSDTVFVNENEVQWLDSYLLNKANRKFLVAKNNDSLYWTRARKFIETHVDEKLPITTSMPNIIESRSSKDDQLKRTFRIVKTPSSNGTLEYELTTAPYNEDLEKYFAFYIQNGYNFQTLDYCDKNGK